MLTPPPLVGLSLVTNYWLAQEDNNNQHRIRPDFTQISPINFSIQYTAKLLPFTEFSVKYLKIFTNLSENIYKSI